MDASEKLERLSCAVMAVAARPARFAAGSAGSAGEEEGEGAGEEDTVGRRGGCKGLAGPGHGAGGADRGGVGQKMPLCAMRAVRRGQGAPSARQAASLSWWVFLSQAHAHREPFRFPPPRWRPCASGCRWRPCRRPPAGPGAAPAAAAAVAAPGAHQHPRRAHAQPAEHRPGHSAQPAHRHYRAVGLGQVKPGVRHAVCRGPAPLCGKPVHLCAPVSGPPGQARCGPDRGPVARHCHRAKGHQPQPALDGGHGDRNPRLPAPAVRPRRHALLPRPPPAAAVADRQPDGGRGAGTARGHAPDGAGAGGAREKRRVHRAVHRHAGARLCALSGQRCGVRARRPAGFEENRKTRHRRGD